MDNPQDPDKRQRREIANCNERKRMQSINAGFNSLKALLPTKVDHDKLSKAAILQHTAEHVDNLEREKTVLLEDLCHIRGVCEAAGIQITRPAFKRERGQESDTEGICPNIGDDNYSIDFLRSELVETRKLLDKERAMRLKLEEHVKQLESELYPVKIKEISSQASGSRFEGGSLENSENENDIIISAINEDEVRYEMVEVETEPYSNPLFISSPPGLQVTALPRTTTTTVTKPGRSPAALRGKKGARAIAVPMGVPSFKPAPSKTTIQIISQDEMECPSSNKGGHNALETIVEAIRHLEGGHVFKDEEDSIIQLGDRELIVSAEPVLCEEYVPEQEVEIPVKTTTKRTAKAKGGRAKVTKAK